MMKVWEIKCMCRWQCSAPSAGSAVGMFARHYAACGRSPFPDKFEVVEGDLMDHVRTSVENLSAYVVSF